MATDSRARKALVARIRESRRVLVEELNAAERFNLLLAELKEAWAMVEEAIHQLAAYEEARPGPVNGPETGQSVGSPALFPPQ
jgi:hypothetical protein